MATEQNYKNHRRYLPIVHFVIQPILTANVVLEIIDLFKNPSGRQAWQVLVWAAVLAFTFMARSMALSAQNRVIRLEERLRLATLLPADQRGRINDLTTRQLIGLRYASDEEVANLAQRCLAGELKGSEDVKKAVKNWRADHLRV